MTTLQIIIVIGLATWATGSLWFIKKTLEDIRDELKKSNRGVK